MSPGLTIGCSVSQKTTSSAVGSGSVKSINSAQRRAADWAWVTSVVV